MITRARFDLLPRKKSATILNFSKDWAGCIILRDSGREHILFLLPRLAYGIPTAQLLLHRFCNGMLMFSPGICVYQSGPLLLLCKRIRVFVVILRNLPLNCECRHLPDVGRDFQLLGFGDDDFRGTSNSESPDCLQLGFIV
ncbi:hypothetical protein ASPFODRAFT_53480 [Aspergillus luchuensis CBS 106.47]|uniref:Uncharacterized protein n=1 Tax=Aspergillus luchuensis (strain CBS 106.47) TaxID=1137211 RepID=A0A1M3T0Q8_ASPLC|nr:hypothetical protein ASPFODRAFT_53480 [Aspergillus luchuensis CBS 106.47]